MKKRKGGNFICNFLLIDVDWICQFLDILSLKKKGKTIKIILVIGKRNCKKKKLCKRI